MRQKSFSPYHMNANETDFEGNNGIGRYVLLPGSNGRAEEIAKLFHQLEVKEHPRGHHLYKGTILYGKKSIEVAAISTGMGCPSIEIILHELFQLGAKRFLRVGTAGSLQSWVKKGDIVNVQASVRDEDTTIHYAPKEIPAIASLEFVSSVLLAAESLSLCESMHTGTVHCKSALYAREFCEGPYSEENKKYKHLLKVNGVLASEMETAALFIQSQIYNHQLQEKGSAPQNRVLAGAILAVITEESETEFKENMDVNFINSINALALESIKTLAIQELFD